MRVEEGGGSECRPVMGRIGIEAVSRHYPARKRADFRQVLLHENHCDTSTENCAEEPQSEHARSGSSFDWRDTNWSDCHRRVRSLQVRIVKAWQEGKRLQGENLAADARPLAERQSFGRSASDGEPRQTDAGRGRGDLVHTGGQIASRVVAQTAWLPAASIETGVHPEKQRQDASAWDSDNEGPRGAGPLPVRAGPSRGNHGGRQLLWIPAEEVGG